MTQTNLNVAQWARDNFDKAGFRHARQCAWFIYNHIDELPGIIRKNKRWYITDASGLMKWLNSRCYDGEFDYYRHRVEESIELIKKISADLRGTRGTV